MDNKDKEYNLSPICLFVYNRPWHTRQTLESLKNNYLADQSELIIYSDGPQTDTNGIDTEKVNEVRRVIKEKKWCKNVRIVEAEKNKGLADSIIDGVTEVVNNHGKIIVLEDDLLLSRGFLKFMNEALRIYENEARIMHVSGFMFPVKVNLPETFFLNIASCWGWGTWERAWNYFVNDPLLLLHQMEKKGEISKFNLDGAYNWLKDLKANIDGSLKSWAIRWYASFFLVGGYCLHPRQSLVKNIGLDGSGINCGSIPFFDNQDLAINIEVKKIDQYESVEARQAVKELFWKINKTSLFRKIKNLTLNFFKL